MLTIADIKGQILAAKAASSSLDGLDSTSKVSIYNLWAFIVASVIWMLYQFFYFYTLEMDGKIQAQRVYSLLWFRDKALEYRHGHPLVLVKHPQNGYNLGYNDAGYTDKEIEDAKAVKRAAVIELEVTNRKFLFVKVATENGAELQELTVAQKQGLVDYFKRIKPAGTKLEIFSDKADNLKLVIDFFYDPLVLTDTGARIDGASNTPVQDAIREYLKNLRFNGEFSVSQLEDLLQSVPGCSDREAYVRAAQANFQTPENYGTVEDIYIANSGYMQIEDTNLTIDFKAKTVIN